MLYLFSLCPRYPKASCLYVNFAQRGCVFVFCACCFLKCGTAWCLESHQECWIPWYPVTNTLTVSLLCLHSLLFVMYVMFFLRHWQVIILSATLLSGGKQMCFGSRDQPLDLLLNNKNNLTTVKNTMFLPLDGSVIENLTWLANKIIHTRKSKGWPR